MDKVYKVQKTWVRRASGSEEVARDVREYRFGSLEDAIAFAWQPYLGTPPTGCGAWDVEGEHGLAKVEISEEPRIAKVHYKNLAIGDEVLVNDRWVVVAGFGCREEVASYDHEMPTFVTTKSWIETTDGERVEVASIIPCRAADICASEYLLIDEILSRGLLVQSNFFGKYDRPGFPHQDWGADAECAREQKHLFGNS